MPRPILVTSSTQQSSFLENAPLGLHTRVQSATMALCYAKLMKGILVDAAVLSGLIILPMWFLGPGRRTNPDPGLGGTFEELHPLKDQLQRHSHAPGIRH